MPETRAIRITAGAVTMEAVLNGSATATRIWEALPIDAVGRTWGDEIYFEIPIKAALDKDAQAVVELGALGYWPPGSAFCIFFGPTPASRNSDEIRPYSPVNVVGQVRGDSRAFKAVRSGTTIRLEAVPRA